MSGRPKGAPLTPEQERDQLRQLTRELHEAAQGAREATREVNAAKKALDMEARRVLQQAIDEILAALTKWGDIQLGSMREEIDKVDKRMQEHFAQIADCADPAELMGVIVRQVTQALMAWVDEQAGLVRTPAAPSAMDDFRLVLNASVKTVRAVSQLTDHG